MYTYYKKENYCVYCIVHYQYQYNTFSIGQMNLLIFIKKYSANVWSFDTKWCLKNCPAAKNCSAARGLFCSNTTILIPK